MAWGKEKGRFGSKVPRLEFPLSDNNTATTLVEEDLPTRADLVGYSRDVQLKGIELIDYIQNVKKYGKQNLRQSRAILLYGPPGTGKTSFPRMIHRETAGKSVYAVADLSTIRDDFEGSAEVKLHQLFDEIESQATRLQRQDKKSLIVHFDEIETIILDRDTISPELQWLVNIFNTRMSDLLEVHKNVVIIATTNRQKAIDGASLRRFEQFYVGLPTKEGRVQTFAHYIYMAIHKHNNANSDLFNPELVNLLNDYGEVSRKVFGRNWSDKDLHNFSEKYLAINQVFAACANVSQGFSQDDIRHIIDNVVESYFHETVIRRGSLPNKIDAEYIYKQVLRWRNTELVERNRKMMQQQGMQGGLRVA